MKNLKEKGSLLLITVMMAAGGIVAMLWHIPIKRVMENYSYNVLVILMSMELFTNLIVGTGVMEWLAVHAAGFSKGRHRQCLWLFGLMMFIISAFLNNITAVMMILPVIFVMLRALEVDTRFISTFFAVILSLSNTGGAASPIGDFPAIVIMTSGITDFLNYLWRAFGLFLVTSLVLLLMWTYALRSESGDGTVRELAVRNLKSQYRNHKPSFGVLGALGGVFALMFCAWSFIPPDTLPPETVAMLGFAAALSICALAGMKIRMEMDMKSIATIASFLFFAEAVSQTGVLRELASFLQAHIENPKLLVLVIMVITSLVSGLCSAGPAAAAMMPVITDLCRGSLGAQSHWIAVAYAAAICAGSSLFMWSATAGFILSNRVNEAGFRDEESKKLYWNVGQYLGYGVCNYLVQIGIALSVIYWVL